MSVGHYENFPVASLLVPARFRPAVVAIYRFARAADDLADEGDAAPGERIAALDAFDAALDRIEQGDTPAGPPFPALAAAIREHGLPFAPFHDLVSAFRQDVTVTRYATFAALLDYCRRSANPVGRLLLALYRAETPANLAASDAICTGLQLTNFWQDIAIDWRRIAYICRRRTSRASTSPKRGSPLATPTSAGAGCWPSRPRGRGHFSTPAGRSCARCRGASASNCRWCIAGGQRILRRIDAVGGDVFAQRPVLAARDWCAVAYRSLVPQAAAEP